MSKIRGFLSGAGGVVIYARAMSVGCGFFVVPLHSKGFELSPLQRCFYVGRYCEISDHLERYAALRKARVFRNVHDIINVC